MATDEERAVFRNAMYPVDAAALAICRERGHEHSGSGITEGLGPTWSVCRWCGARFRWTEPELVEHPDTPDP